MTLSIAGFYARRARRILPAAVLTLLVTDVAAHHLLNFVRARQVVSDSIWATAFSANVHFARQGSDYFAQNQPPSPLLHFWSLSVEEQFYFVWPLLLATVLFARVRVGEDRRRKLLVVVIALAAASLAWSVWATATAPTAMNIQLMTVTEWGRLLIRSEEGYASCVQ